MSYDIIINHNAFDQLNQPLTALAKKITFVWVQSKVIRQNYAYPLGS